MDDPDDKNVPPNEVRSCKGFSTPRRSNSVVTSRWMGDQPAGSCWSSSSRISFFLRTEETRSKSVRRLEFLLVHETTNIVPTIIVSLTPTKSLVLHNNGLGFPISVKSEEPTLSGLHIHWSFLEEVNLPWPTPRQTHRQDEWQLAV